MSTASAGAPLAVYVHTPFCPSKCGYCDFNSYAMSGDIMRRTTEAMLLEIAASPWRGRPAKTIFFGGGTPTYLPTGQLLQILVAIFEVHPPVSGCEITSEANPGTADAEKFQEMRRAGFNRLSLGAQSFLDSDLITLGRVHKSGEIERAVELARQAGFENLNLDLMFALPHQSSHAWKRNLERAFSLKPEHLSLYCLTLEPNTPFYKAHLKGDLTTPDEDAQAGMYDLCVQLAEQKGYAQYEISNFAQPGRACQHNLEYWRSEEYASYGPGAVGAVDRSGVRHRYTVLKHPERYCEALEAGQPIWFDEEDVTPDMLRTERIMMGIRLNEGLGTDTLEPSSIQRLTARGWIWHEGGRVGLTPSGRHFGSQVALELL